MLLGYRIYYRRLAMASLPFKVGPGVVLPHGTGPTTSLVISRTSPASLYIVTRSPLARHHHHFHNSWPTSPRLVLPQASYRTRMLQLPQEFHFISVKGTLCHAVARQVCRTCLVQRCGRSTYFSASLLLVFSDGTSMVGTAVHTVQSRM